MLSFSATRNLPARCQAQMPGGVATVPSPSPPDTRQELGRNTHSGQEGWEEASEVEWGAESVQGTGLCDHPRNHHNHHLQTGCKNTLPEAPEQAATDTLGRSEAPIWVGGDLRPHSSCPRSRVKKGPAAPIQKWGSRTQDSEPNT